MSSWNTAKWNEDRWASVPYEFLVQQKPTGNHNPFIGADDWRLAVELLLPDDGESVWGVGEWNSAVWNDWSWYDITEDVRGLSWTRGSDAPYGRPRIGDLNVTLSSGDNSYSPWNTDQALYQAAYYAPGTVIRVGAYSATDTRAGGWLPQFCGIIETWDIMYVAGGADMYAEITAFETLRFLSEIDNNAGSSVGAGDLPRERIPRLLDDAEWPFGVLIEAQHLVSPATNHPLQATDMSSNRLAECYLTADSSDSQFRSSRRGEAMLTMSDYVGAASDADPEAVPLVEFSYDAVSATPYNRQLIYFGPTTIAPSGSNTVWRCGYDINSFETTNDAEHIINDVRIARVGGTEQVHVQLASVARYGTRLYQRGDFISQSDSSPSLIGYYYSIRRGLNTLRVNNLTLNAQALPDDAQLCALAMDVYDPAFVYPPNLQSGDPVILGWISKMTHRVTPSGDGELTWLVDVATDTRVVYNIPAAQLPNTPQ